MHVRRLWSSGVGAGLASAALCAALLLGCAAPAPAAPPGSATNPAAGQQPSKPAEPEITTVKVGAFPISSLAPFYIAEMKGWFQEEGLTIEKIPQFGPQGLTVLESGSMDLNFGDTISTTVALSKGFKFTIVAPASSARDAPPDSSTLLVVSGGPVRSTKDLEGRRVATDAIGGIGWTYFNALMDQQGDDPKKVQFVEMPFPQMPDALLNNQVDGALVVEPGRSFALATGRVEALLYPTVTVQPGAEISHVVAKEDWVRRNPETLRRFQRAYAKGIAFVNSNEAEARQLIAEYAKLPPEIAERMALNAFRPAVRPEIWQEQIGLMVKYRLLDAPLEIRPFIHDSALNLPR